MSCGFLAGKAYICLVNQKNKIQDYMKRQIVSLMFAAMGVGLLGACGSSESRISDLKDFVEEVSKDGEKYSEEQWEKANKKFSELLEKVESYDDLSTEELTEVAKLQGVYAAQAFKSQGKKFKDSLKEIGAAMDGFLEGLDEGLDEAKEDSTEEKD